MCMDPRPLDMSSFPRPGPLDSSLSFSLQLPHCASCLAPTLGTQVTLTGMVAESSCFVANANLPSTIRVNSLNPSSFSNPGLVAHGTGLGTAISWKHKAHSGHLEASPPQSTQKYPTAPTGESQRYVASREEPRGPSVERTRQAHTLTHHKNPKTFQKETGPHPAQVGERFLLQPQTCLGDRHEPPQIPELHTAACDWSDNSSSGKQTPLYTRTAARTLVFA